MSDSTPLEQVYITTLINAEMGTTLAYEEEFNEDALVSLLQNFFNMGTNGIRTFLSMVNTDKQVTLNPYEWHQVPYSIQVKTKD